MTAHCNRDRLLEILATRTAEMRGVPPEQRKRFVCEHVTEWRHTLAAAYGGETARVRVTTEKRLLENRSQRDATIVRLAKDGIPTRSIAERMRVSMRLVQLVIRRAA